MTVKTDISASDFKWNESWSGGRDTCKYLTEDEIETVFELLEESNCGEPMDLTDLNDFFWFEDDTIAEWLGYEDFEHLMNRDDDEESED